jgi:hypothetical protein
MIVNEVEVLIRVDDTRAPIFVYLETTSGLVCFFRQIGAIAATTTVPTNANTAAAITVVLFSIVRIL